MRANRITTELRQLATVGVHPSQSLEVQKHIRLANLFALSAAGTCLALAPWFFLWEQAGWIRLEPFLDALLFLGIVGLNGRGYHLAARSLLLLLANLAVFIISAQTGRDSGYHVYYFVLAWMPFLLFELKQWRRMTAFAILPAALYCYLRYHDHVVAEWLRPIPGGEIFYWFTMVGTFGLCVANAIYFVLESQRSTTTLQRMLDALTQKETQLRLAFETGELCIWDYWPARMQVELCERSKRVMGLAQDAPPLDRAGIERTVHPEDLAYVLATLTRVREGQPPCSMEYRLVRPDGQVIWMGGYIQAFGERNGQAERVLGILREITEEKEAQARLEQQRMKMLVQSKMSALGEMSGGIAHEINNPLTIIQGNARLLRDLIEKGDLADGRAAKLCERIDATTLRISKIVRALHAFARNADQDPFAMAKVSALLVDTLELCQQRFKNRGVELRMDAVPDSLALECRSTQVCQILVNLFNNAYDAVHASEGPWVHLQVTDQDEFVEFSVTDSGPGIPAFARPRLFQPFFTTKEVGKGTGLGLSISLGIAQAHGGSLVYDENCPHTRFVLRLPKQQRLADARAVPMLGSLA